MNARPAFGGFRRSAEVLGSKMGSERFRCLQVIGTLHWPAGKAQNRRWATRRRIGG